MGDGVRDFAKLAAAPPRAIARLGLVLATLILSLASGAVLAKGSLQDLVGSYPLSAKNVEGNWCGTVVSDAAAMGTFEVASVDDSSISVSLAGGASQSLPFDSSALSFRYEYEDQGYKMSYSGQFIRGEDSVAIAMVANWRPQIDCVATLGGSKPAPALSEPDATGSASSGTDSYQPGEDEGWNPFDDDGLMIFIALIVLLLGATVAYKRGNPAPEPAPEPAPDPEPAQGGGGVGGLAALMTRGIAPLSGMPIPPLVAPVSGLDPLLSYPPNPFQDAKASASATLEDGLTQEQRDFLHPPPNPAPFVGNWHWHDGTRAVLTDKRDTQFQTIQVWKALKDNGQKGLWFFGQNGKVLTVSWEKDAILVGNQKGLDSNEVEVFNITDPHAPFELTGESGSDLYSEKRPPITVRKDTPPLDLNNPRSHDFQ